MYERIANEKFNKADPLWYSELIESCIQLENYALALETSNESLQTKFNVYAQAKGLLLTQFGDTVPAPDQLRVYPRQLARMIPKIYEPAFLPLVEGTSDFFTAINRNFDEIAFLIHNKGDIHRLSGDEEAANQHFVQYQSFYQALITFLEKKREELFKQEKQVYQIDRRIQEAQEKIRIAHNGLIYLDILKEKRTLQSRNQNILIFGLILTSVFIIVIYRYYQKQKFLNKKLNLQQKSLWKKQQELEFKNLEINKKNTKLNKSLINLREAQEKLVLAEKMASLGHLTAGIAHEINNPINFIKSSSNTILRNIRDIKEVVQAYDKLNSQNFKSKLPEVQQLKEDLELDIALKELSTQMEDIQIGVDRTAEIVDSLRRFSRSDEYESSHIDLHKNLDSTLTLLKYQTKDQIEIIKDYGDIPPIEAYSGPLNQVFMNILTNAIQAIEEFESKAENKDMKGKGKITIQTKAQSDQVKISIADTGIGIAEKVKKDIFNPFFTTKEVGKGTGFGLSIAHTIIQEHQGSIKVESQPNQGSKFTITIPITQHKRA